MHGHTHDGWGMNNIGNLKVSIGGVEGDGEEGILFSKT